MFQIIPVEEIKYIIKESEGDAISLHSLLTIIKEKILVFVIVFTAVMLAAAFYVFSQKPYYYTKISVGSANFTGNTIEPMVTALSELRKDGNYDELAARLNISKDAADDILKIEIRNKVTLKDFYSADIALKVANPNSIPEISNGFMQYFDNSPYISNRLNVIRGELEIFTKNGETELVRLDSLKKSLALVLADKAKTASNIIFPSNIHLEAVNINEKVYQARQDLKLLKGVELLSKPTVPNKAANPSAILLMAAATVAALVSGAVAALVAAFAGKK